MNLDIRLVAIEEWENIDEWVLELWVFWLLGIQFSKTCFVSFERLKELEYWLFGVLGDMCHEISYGGGQLWEND